MELSWIQSIGYGFLSGLTDILPVSAQAHKVLLLKFFGAQVDANLLDLLIRLGTMGALYVCSQAQLVRMRRARALARIPKKRRNRPLDTRSLMDWSLLKTMLLPVIASFFLLRYVEKLDQNMILVALFLFLNGLILYIPQLFPTGNRDSRTLSRVEGLLMGLGGAVSVLPGISSVGAAASVGSVCGVDRGYALNMALMMHFVVSAGHAVYDVIGMSGTGGLSFALLVQYLITAAFAFCGTFLGVRLMRRLAQGKSFVLFAFYCWGLALFTFILNLVA